MFLDTMYSRHTNVYGHVLEFYGLCKLKSGVDTLHSVQKCSKVFSVAALRFLFPKRAAGLSRGLAADRAPAGSANRGRAAECAAPFGDSRGAGRAQGELMGRRWPSTHSTKSGRMTSRAGRTMVENSPLTLSSQAATCSPVELS